MNYRNIASKFSTSTISARARLRSAYVAACITAFGASSNALAAVDTAAVQTALTGAETDAQAVGGMVIAVVAGLVVVGLIISMVKKI